VTSMIESYRFGSITIDGKKYTKDLIVFPDRIQPDWWRKTGHLLTLEDIQEILDYRPRVLVIGTGVSGLMKVDDAVLEKLESMDIEYVIERSSKVVKEYNKVCDKRAVLALHLTC